jgi:hypothetical protein
MIEQLVARPGQLDDLGGLFAVLSNGDLYHCDLEQPDWVPILCGGPIHVNALDLASG